MIVVIFLNNLIVSRGIAIELIGFKYFYLGFRKKFKVLLVYDLPVQQHYYC